MQHLLIASILRAYSLAAAGPSCRLSVRALLLSCQRCVSVCSCWQWPSTGWQQHGSTWARLQEQPWRQETGAHAAAAAAACLMTCATWCKQVVVAFSLFKQSASTGWFLTSVFVCMVVGSWFTGLHCPWWLAAGSLACTVHGGWQLVHWLALSMVVGIWFTGLHCPWWLAAGSLACTVHGDWQLVHWLALSMLFALLPATQRDAETDAAQPNTCCQMRVLLTKLLQLSCC
jgi:hypothetical protein